MLNHLKLAAVFAAVAFEVLGTAGGIEDPSRSDPPYALLQFLARPFRGSSAELH